MNHPFRDKPKYDSPQHTHAYKQREHRRVLIVMPYYMDRVFTIQLHVLSCQISWNCQLVGALSFCASVWLWWNGYIKTYSFHVMTIMEQWNSGGWPPKVGVTHRDAGNKI